MKVLLVINSSNNGGAIKMIVTLYEEMKKHYPDSKIVFLKKIESQYSSIEGAYYLQKHLSSPLHYISVYKKLDKIVREESPNALISFLPLANILSGVIGRKYGVKTRIASQRNPPQIYGKVVRFLDRFIGSRGYYTANVCNSEAGMQAFSNYPNNYKKLLSVINNCVEPADFSFKVEDAKAKMGSAPKGIVLTCVGRLHDQKNHAVLVKAMKYIDDAVLYCAGDGPLRGSLTELIKKEGVENKVVLLGDLNREEVRILLRATDIFVIPSKYEGLSNSLIEALSYGLPVVFSNIPSFTSFLRLNADNEQYVGVLVKENEESKWAEAINGILSNQQKLQTCKSLSFDKVAELTAEKMTTKFIDLFYEKN